MKQLMILTLSLFYFSEILAGTGVFSLIEGRVYVQKEEDDEKRARRGTRIEAGDTVRSEEGAYAKVTMSDKNVFHIGPDTKVTFTSYQTDGEENEDGSRLSQLSVAYGKVRSALEQKYDLKQKQFQVTTEALIMGVRGTDFLTTHNDTTQQTKTVLFEGKLAVAPIAPGGLPSINFSSFEGSVDLNRPGAAVLATPGAPPVFFIAPPGTLQNIDTNSLKNSPPVSFKKDVDDQLKKDPTVVSSAIDIPEVNRLPRQESMSSETIERNIISNGGETAVPSVVIDVIDNS